MKSKRGDFFTENAMTIVLAIIGLSLLFFGVVKILEMGKQESESAKNAINSIEDRIKGLEYGEESKFPFRGPDGWNLYGWSKNDKTRPDKCFFNSCICICKGKYVFTTDRENKYKCEDGFCRELAVDLVSVQSPAEDFEITGNYVQGIEFPPNLIEIVISKNDEDGISDIGITRLG